MDINNLMENVRSFFTEQYKGVEKSDIFLSFEPLGCMLDPADFADENNQVSEIKAIEQLSILSDRLPEIDDIFLANTDRLSTAYETLLESTVFTGTKITAEDKTSYIARFGEVKSEALQQFNDGKKASISRPEGNYLPVYGFPKKWYDPASPFWVNKTFSSIEKPPPNGDQPAPPIVKPMLTNWRTKLEVDPQLLVQKVQPTGVAEALKPFLHARLATEVKPVQNVKFNRMRTNRLGAFNMTEVKGRRSLVDVAAAEPVSNRMLLSNLNLFNKIALADRVNVTRDIVAAAPPQVAPVQANGFTMSFDYCIAYLQRPWFNSTLFNYANMWYCLSLPENFFSTGTKDETNKGILKCLPTAMILIKNLRIKAAWTDEDKANAQNSIGLGVFNLNNSTFSNNELVTPGMQIIGWMCEVMPKLPALPDPNIT